MTKREQRRQQDEKYSRWLALTDIDRRKLLLPIEQIYLKNDPKMYLDCLGTPLADRKTAQEIRAGLILFFGVYCHIRQITTEKLLKLVKV
jgi:hypothetical protein